MNDSYPPRLLDELTRLQQAALASDYALKQTAYLANNIGPRLSGSPQAQRAVEYVAEEMRKLGLDVMLEKTLVPHWVRGVEVGELTQFPGMAPGASQKILLTALGGSVATSPEGVIAPVVVVNNFDELNALDRAKDDAAGVAVAMQAANLCRQLDLNPGRTIRVIAWMNEENGGRGGATYFQNQSNNLANHIAAIESDLGAGHPIGFFAHVESNALPMLQPIAKVLESSGAGAIHHVTDSVGVDIELLENAGIPGFAPIQDDRTYFNYHHTAADTFDKVNPRELAENAAVVAVLAYAIANLKEPLPKRLVNN